MRTINFSDARKQFKEVLDRVVDDADITIITRRDADDVVLMSLASYNSWQETMYLMASPENARWLNESIAQARAGHARPRDLIAADEHALAVAEPHKPYGVTPKRAGTRGRSRKR
ncbi:MAG TPA: type II toxin-antitoxin system prevent-host-death family antitoxin [Rhodanobacteraceae bacterium]|nr:type II toxin-antitoxin system prevent-host-death family antitoxin [Rhodanobacteraceae bacterium]